MKGSDLTFAKIKEFYELGLAKPSFFTNIFMAGQRKENNNRIKFFDIINNFFKQVYFDFHKGMGLYYKKKTDLEKL